MTFHLLHFLRRVITLFVFLVSSYSWSANEYVYLFENGNSLSFLPASVRFLSADGNALYVWTDCCSLYPYSEAASVPKMNSFNPDKFFDSTPLGSEMLRANQIAVFATPTKYIFVHENGHFLEIEQVPGGLNFELVGTTSTKVDMYQTEYFSLFKIRSSSTLLTDRYLLLTRFSIQSLELKDNSNSEIRIVNVSHSNGVFTIKFSNGKIHTIDYNLIRTLAHEPQNINPHSALATTPKASLPKPPALMARSSRVPDPWRNFDSHMFKNNEGNDVLLRDYVLDFLRPVQADSSYNLHEKDQDLINEIALTLNQPKMKNAVIIAPPGTGKTFLLEQIVAQYYQGRFNLVSPHTRFFYLSASSIVAGGKYVGEVANRVKAIIELAQNYPVVLLVDEIHTLEGAGSYVGSKISVFDMLLTALGDDRLSIVGTSTGTEYSSLTASVPGLERRFRKLEKAPIGNEEVKDVLINFISKQSDKADLEAAGLLDHDIIDRIIYLTNQFDATTAQPAKSVNLANYLIGLLRTNKYKKLSTQEINEAAARRYNVPNYYFNDQELRAKLQSFPEALKEAYKTDLPFLDEVIREVQIKVSGISPMDYATVILLAGPKGTGKSYLPKQIALALGYHYEEIRMSGRGTYSDINDIFIQISNTIKNHGRFVVFNFDEFEKAPLVVQEALLRVLETGRLETLVHDRTKDTKVLVQVDLRNALMFLTTNAVTQPTEDLPRALKDGGLSEYAIDRAKQIHFIPPPSRQLFKQVVISNIKKQIELINRERQLGITLEADLEKLAEEITQQLYREGMSLRSVDRTIGDHIRKAVLNRFLDSAKAYVLKCDDFLNIKPEPEPEPRRIGF